MSQVVVVRSLERGLATGLVAEGVDVKTAQARLGHSDPRLTRAIYAQATGEAATRIGARFLLAKGPTSRSSSGDPGTRSTPGV